VDPSNGGTPSCFRPVALGLYTATYLVLMSLGAGLAIPGGLFMPSVRRVACGVVVFLAHDLVPMLLGAGLAIPGGLFMLSWGRLLACVGG